MKSFVCCLLLSLFVLVSPNQAAPPSGPTERPMSYKPVAPDPDLIPLIPASQLRRLARHDAGVWSLPITCGGFPAYGNYTGSFNDPETDLRIGNAVFPVGTNNQYLFSSGIWVGGIVNGDTLVSSSYDSWWGGIYEFWPPDPEQGGVYRSGNFADDEFVAIYTDTVTAPYVTWFNPFDDTSHIPLGVKLTQRSYSWQDTLYDDFVIIEIVIENLYDDYIDEGWFGIIADPDIYVYGGAYSANGWADDASGVLDTLLYDGDNTSRVVIPYAFDMDGDPGLEGEWDHNSVPGVISIAALSVPGADPAFNFNWWLSDDNVDRDFGPRRVGTVEDPFRPFAGDYLGTAHRQEDKYYLMSHPELDYNQIEMDVHDSTDGWIPSSRSLLNSVNDTKFFISYGPFDLPPHDSVTIAFAVVGSEGFHVNPSDFRDYFDPALPQEFQSRLNFSELMINHRRADSVYRSGLQLPAPGPPVGLQVVDYNDNEVVLTWNQSRNGMLAGYYVNVKDTIYDDVWRRAHIEPITDTIFTFFASNPGHEHLFAVSVVDTMGRESGFSFELPFTPATPHPPCDLAAELDYLTPVLTWRPYNDTSLTGYMIYRAAWKEAYELYDSVSALEYRDYGAESGVWYNYKVAAKNDLQLESDPTGPVTVLPMALDKGVLFYDMNYDYSVHVDPYHRRHVDRLVDAVQPLISMDYYDIEDGFLPFKTMSDYSLIVFDSEMRGGEFRLAAIDSIRNYLHFGGKALFIISNASTNALGMIKTNVSVYGEGSLFHDYLFLDSAMTNGIVLLDGSIRGDLMGCLSLTPEYPPLAADSEKIASTSSPIPVEGYIPLAGFLYPREGVEYLYSYQSMYPDSVFHNQINGIRYLADTGSFVFFNFQLSLMEAPNNLIAFRQALTDLGFNLSCGDINDNQMLEIGDVVSLVAFLFRDGPEPPDIDRADVNCDGDVNLGDVQMMINTIFFKSGGLHCCPQE